DAKLVHVPQAAGNIDQLAGALREHRAGVADPARRPGLAVDDPVAVLLAAPVFAGGDDGRIRQVLFGDEVPGSVGLDDVSVSIDDHLASPEHEATRESSTYQPEETATLGAAMVISPA